MFSLPDLFRCGPDFQFACGVGKGGVVSSLSFFISNIDFNPLFLHAYYWSKFGMSIRTKGFAELSIIFLFTKISPVQLFGNVKNSNVIIHYVYCQIQKSTGPVWTRLTDTPKQTVTRSVKCTPKESFFGVRLHLTYDNFNVWNELRILSNFMTNVYLILATDKFRIWNRPRESLKVIRIGLLHRL